MIDLIDRRYSCRAYAERPIAAEHKAALEAFMATRTRGPLGSAARFRLIAAAPDDGDALRRLGTYGFIKGATGFILGAVRKGPGDLEDYGYLLEEIVLHATGLGLGTCWLGGTFTRGSFTTRFGGVSRDEAIPAVISTGYPGDGDGGSEAGADRGGWDGYSAALRAVRMGPSATNRQPWRIVRRGRDWHFYVARTKGYGKGSLAFKLLRIADLQRVDLGIAMCHFELAARETGHSGSWRVEDPDVALPAGSIEYTATWRDES